MKHSFILIVFFLFMTLPSKAQWVLTPEIGISTSKLIHSTGLDNQRTVSWKVGTGVEYKFNNYWGISSGIYWSQPKWDDMMPLNSITEGYASMAYLKYKANCFRLPIMASYYIPVKSIKFGLSFGPYIGYGTKCKVSTDILEIPYYLNPGGGYAKTTTTTSLDSYFDWGLTSRISLDIDKYLIRFEYEVPFTSVMNPHKATPVFSILSLTVGYRFCFSK